MALLTDNDYTRRLIANMMLYQIIIRATQEAFSRGVKSVSRPQQKKQTSLYKTFK
jgi:hypothetical protein